MADRAGLLVDWGGVLTSDIFASFAAFCVAEGLAPDTARELFRHSAEGRRLLHELETGELPEARFEVAFCALLGLPPDRAAGLVDRLFGGMRPDEAMLGAVRAARAAGLRTGLVSNSWGHDRYDQRILALFDAVVISGHEGIRKPDPRMYALGAERLGLPPEACVYVDDLAGNLKPARALGMATIHHVDAAATIAQLEELLGVPLQG
ncbi:MAG TPA: HAD family phosphatase [Solirubrobacteraceae bacterium]|nr:HAD family phosphatase [Solirubrobacteraceae bacterium]